ncbi:MAG: trehalose-6-phosphate synthase [Dactylosporangium sp.]|nr:trehalose-6-phosphate synthase [Dactylosporangium sp.]NNJ63042.1 trehalose-6-phosphate synthase [Dactylosporangium sp.]
MAGVDMDRLGKHEFVVVADRLPVDQVRGADGVVDWQRSPGALASALHPVVAARRGAWVGWGGLADAIATPFSSDTMWLYPVSLSAQEVEDHHEGQCGSTIAPLYHDALASPAFHRRWREAYRQVNQRYAQTVANVAAPGSVVWVQGYQLQLVPAMLRRLRSDLLIGFLLDSPFPPIELYLRMPLRTEVMKGLLGADLIGFQRPRAAENFLTLARHLLGLQASGGQIEVTGRRVHTGTFPISINIEEIEALSMDPAVRSRAVGVRTELRDPRAVLLAVDRLDHAKGIEQRLAAYGRLLDDGDLDPARTVLIQIAAPSRHSSARSRQLRKQVERQIAELNGRYGGVGRPVVHYLHGTLSRAELVAYYLAADVMLATPLRDGMSLTAKEYVAARGDDSGALVLSEFTGAAADLPHAFVVNPHDTNATMQAMLGALNTEPAMLRHRMRQMREDVRAYTVHHWAGRFLAAIGECAAAPGRQRVPRPAGQQSRSPVVGNR